MQQDSSCLIGQLLHSLPRNELPSFSLKKTNKVEMIVDLRDTRTQVLGVLDGHRKHPKIDRRGTVYYLSSHSDQPTRPSQRCSRYAALARDRCLRFNSLAGSAQGRGSSSMEPTLQAREMTLLIF